MILPQYLQEEVEKFCKIKKIPYIRGKVPSQYVSDIKTFLNERLRKERDTTRRKEEDIKFSIKIAVKKLMKETLAKGKIFQNSPIEEYMGQALIENGFKGRFKCRQKIGTKEVDILFPKERLVVECDGKAYHADERWQINRDQKRDRYLAKKGYRVIHIEGLAIRRSIGRCIEQIEKALKMF